MIKGIPVGVLLFFAHGLVLAQDQQKPERWYDVELIIIQNLDFNRNNTESWPPTGRLPDYTKSIDLYAPPEGEEGEEGGAEEPAEDSAMSEASVQTTGSEDDSDAANDSFEYPEPFSIPADEELSLAGVLTSLRRSRAFRPLLHVAWTQPPLERNEAQPVRIYIPAVDEDDTESQPNGESRQTVFSDVPVQEDAQDKETTEPGFLPESWFDPSKIDLRRPLDGTAMLAVSRYLHLYLDIVFVPVDVRLPDLDESTITRDTKSLRQDLTRLLAEGEITLEEANAQINASSNRDFYGFRLDQSRRMRNGEIHYFDHPAFSVIAIVKPRDFEFLVPDELTGDAAVLQQSN
ncbi:MAG: CsiV family protein [Gammaproteobacteria bacterium]